MPARTHDHPSHPQVISRSAVTMADAVSCTGETLSFSPSTTNPTLTDDSVSASITGKYNAVAERVAGGNAAAAPAASCPIDERKGSMGGPRPSSKRPALFPSSSSEEEEERLEARGKGRGRLTRLPGPKPPARSCPTSRLSSPAALARADPPRPLEPKGGSSEDGDSPRAGYSATRERSPKRSVSVLRGGGDENPKRPNDGRARGPAVYDLSTPKKRSPRRDSRDTVRGSTTATPTSPIPNAGKPPHTPRPGGKGVAETPSSSSGQWNLPVAGDEMEIRLAKAL